MSIRRMTAVWEDSQHKGNELLLLLALADNANDDGYCWPSIDTLAKKTRLSRSTVIRLCEKVEESGELYISHSRRHGNKYLVIIGLQLESVGSSLKTYFKMTDSIISAKLELIESRQKSFIEKTSKCQNDTSEVASCDTSEVSLVLHEPSIEPSIETISDSPSGGQSVDDKPKRVTKPRPRDSIIDTLAVNVLGLDPGVKVPRKSGSWLGGIKSEILELYPDMTGELLATIFEWKKPYTPKNVAKIISMISDYRDHAHAPILSTLPTPSPTDDVWGDPMGNVTAKKAVAA